jgi:hypothetical protein
MTSLPPAVCSAIHIHPTEKVPTTTPASHAQRRGRRGQASPPHMQSCPNAHASSAGKSVATDIRKASLVSPPA